MSDGGVSALRADAFHFCGEMTIPYTVVEGVCLPIGIDLQKPVEQLPLSAPIL